MKDRGETQYDQEEDRSLKFQQVEWQPNLILPHSSPEIGYKNDLATG